MTSPEATDTQVIPAVWQRPQWSGDQQWITEYYRTVPDADVATHSQDTLSKLAEHHREVGKYRNKGELCVDVRQGSNGTELYMVTDDMPFLVSTLTTEIAAKWGGARLVLHPLLLATRMGSEHELES